MKVFVPAFFTNTAKNESDESDDYTIFHNFPPSNLSICTTIFKCEKVHSSMQLLQNQILFLFTLLNFLLLFVAELISQKELF
jgi:hypothetical protein